MENPNNPAEAGDANRDGHHTRHSGSVRRVRVRRRELRSEHENFLWRLIRTEWRFQLLLAIIAIFVAVPVICLARVWKTSPAGDPEVVKVNLIGLIQSWALRRTAQRAVVAGQYPLALRSWQAAANGNRADQIALRGMVQTLVEMPWLDMNWVSFGVRAANSLLKLTHTNESDLELTARLLDRYDLHEMALARLSDTNAPIGVSSSIALMKALFETGQMQNLDEIWRQRSAFLSNAPVAQVYHAAWVAMTGPTELAEGAVNQLQIYETKGQTPEIQVAALRASLRVYFVQLRRLEYEERLKRSEDLRVDRLQDHLRYWLLLDGVGMRQEAFRLTRSSAKVAQTVGDAELQLALWQRLGMKDEVLEFAKHRLWDFGYDPRLCVVLASILEEQKQWDSLRELGLILRQQVHLKPILGGFGYFLEGLSEQGTIGRLRAEDLFKKYAAEPPTYLPAVFQSAATLNRLGHPVVAATLLKTIEPEGDKSASFWQQMQMAAYESHQADLLYNACEKLYRMDPDNPITANNYAAVLLMQSEKQAEALTLTLKVMNAIPDSVSARINHSIALGRMGRAAEGEALLNEIPPDRLSASDRSGYYFAKFQLESILGKSAKARASAAFVNRATLFPGQLQMLNSMLEAIPEN
jgi:tetratricopeptide (TPR) repeat protein